VRRFFADSAAIGMAHMREAAESMQVEVAAPLLTADQVAEFSREGFLALDSPQISQAEIHWCRDILMSLIAGNVGRKEGRLIDISAREDGDGGITPQLCRPSLYATELSKWSYRNMGLAIAKQLLGPEATLSADNAVFKPSRIGGVTPWHQDEAYNNPQFYQEQVTIWIALFDTTPTNGAMAFIPRSHKLGILRHRLNGGSREANSIECCGEFDRTATKLCPIRAGGITIHHGRTIHGASRNLSDGPRLGYVLNYKNPPQARPELGTFSWNDRTARHIGQRRKLWLLRGGIFIEALRFFRSDPDNRRHFIRQVIKRFSQHHDG
jgi:ectoine hydroxylase-related dioxygenase (phytanoyl-CoA dioxygenase family)